MRRLIDADLLSEAIHDNVPAPYEDASWAKENCLVEVEMAPTVDAVPVVRCKDCKHSEKKGVILQCNVWERFSGYGDDGFCCYGERKEGADNEP